VGEATGGAPLHDESGGCLGPRAGHHQEHLTRQPKQSPVLKYFGTGLCHAYMKYIMIDNDGLPTPIMFASTLHHKDVASCFSDNEVISAGFVSREGERDKVHVFGKSDTLKKKVRKDMDAALIHMFLHQDDTMTKESPDDS
jgi:hypothetical protein